MKNIVIIGAGDLGKEIVWLIEDINRIEPTYLILGFLDDDAAKNSTEFYGYKVLGPVSMLDSLTMPFCAVIAIQDGSVRKKIVGSYPNVKNWETIIHPSTVIAGSSTIGMGSIFFPQVTVSVDSRLGNFGLYYIHSTVCNDCRIGDYVSVMAGASVLEHAEIGDEAVLSAGSCIYPHKSIGSCARLGIEAAAAKDIPDGAQFNEKNSIFRV